MDILTADPMVEARRDRVSAQVPTMSDIELLRHLLQTQEGDSFDSEQPWSFRAGMRELNSRLARLFARTE
jgi:hypothetical protein